MKTFFKSLLKWLFTVIIPFGMTSLIIMNYYYNGWLGSMKALVEVVLLIIVWLNALFYVTMMRSTKLLPAVSFEKTPVIGLAMGTNGAKGRYKKWIILIPFVCIEFKAANK